ncbi:hypothetical protein RFI_36239 [Reticulomyxa filosa]|uniref:Uncharacterized protein n=1 Tax=Reticulomyxa filosa TaxID=46433 RepID=X6LIJ9_RETFI|nr:hypothetical protein RFI_36239 [Reticulomyxa filosa]|eukprot:ETO01201.1 hypothetical protein RFI_36239 [Reticulomyxa filosa]
MKDTIIGCLLRQASLSLSLSTRDSKDDDDDVIRRSCESSAFPQNLSFGHISSYVSYSFFVGYIVMISMMVCCSLNRFALALVIFRRFFVLEFEFGFGFNCGVDATGFSLVATIAAAAAALVRRACFIATVALRLVYSCSTELFSTICNPSPNMCNSLPITLPVFDCCFYLFSYYPKYLKMHIQMMYVNEILSKLVKDSGDEVLILHAT